MKKIISILLAIVMCFTMTTVAFAADEEAPEVSKDSITSVLLEAVKAVSNLNDEARAALSEEIEKMLVEQIAGDSVILQEAAQWIVDTALKLSGSDNILDLNKEQAGRIADFLLSMYDGDVADYIDNPLIKVMVNLIPKEVLKEAVVWLLSDGFGDALKDIIDKYGDGEESPEEPENNNPLSGFDLLTVFRAAFQALKDVVKMVVDQIAALFGGAEATPAVS